MTTLKLWIYGALLAGVVALCAASYAKGSSHKQAEWDAENARVATALAVALTETEEIRKVFIDYKAASERQVADLERNVAAGRQRLRVAATCVPASTDTSGTGSGAAELDATARPAYYALRRGLDEQRALLNLCRKTLKSRSK